LGITIGLLLQKRFKIVYECFNIDVQNLNNIHYKIILKHGSLHEEYPEQLLSIKYIKSDDKVLELGGNVGRNSCVIATLLSDSSNLLVIESDNDNIHLLKENRDINKLNFYIENSAISNIDLYQKEWITKPIEEINDIENWKKINTKSWKDIKNKYNIEFNTLVVDCEGALYYILKENPDFLQSFNKIIIENDFYDITHKEFVDSEFKRNNFIRIHKEQGGFGPCTDFFYEVWIK
jgi:FkbM family methyltransferase